MPLPALSRTTHQTKSCTTSTTGQMSSSVDRLRRYYCKHTADTCEEGASALVHINVAFHLSAPIAENPRTPATVILATNVTSFLTVICAISVLLVVGPFFWSAKLATPFLLTTFCADRGKVTAGHHCHWQTWIPTTQDIMLFLHGIVSKDGRCDGPATRSRPSARYSIPR